MFFKSLAVQGNQKAPVQQILSMKHLSALRKSFCGFLQQKEMSSEVFRHQRSSSIYYK
jgi:hypothetical protein